MLNLTVEAFANLTLNHLRHFKTVSSMILVTYLCKTQKQKQIKERGRYQQCPRPSPPGAVMA